MERFESKIVGIDLGTTNTVIAYYDEVAKWGECCTTSEGTHFLPSAVSFEDRGTYTVGSVAREEALLYPDRTAVNFKRKMGGSKEALLVDDRAFPPSRSPRLY